MKVSFVNKLSEKKETLVIVSDKSSMPKIAGLGQKTLNSINLAIKNENFKFNKLQTLEIISSDKLGYSKIIIIGLGEDPSVSLRESDLIGGKITQLNSKTNSNIDVLVSKNISNDESMLRIGYGSILATYKFDKYKSKKSKTNFSKTIKLVSNKNSRSLSKKFNHNKSVAQGVFLARDLVNEPSNILNPEDYAKRIKGLSKYGLKVEVLNEVKMKKLGMDSLLGVGRGSQYDSQLVIIKWDGLKTKKTKPLCFVGKGVCFDSGGISLKPGNKMEEMIGDMGGSAAVVGLMKSLALRKAKANVVGIVGLVENMPDGTAQKPGDIVNTMSGQTIEIQNTDAEGRLVLADALWYAQDRFKPEFMIDLATLTGAIVMSLGNKMAGIFSNNDSLSDKLFIAGEESGDLVWRLPLSSSYDKMINSQFADMKNIGMGGAGSITAAQFLKRFVNKVPWVHVDIAGTATGMEKNSINTSWATGFGVHLLDTLVSKFYE
ncbi:MAG: leucyl aminopeptidase [Alphaproteobacteria bacterium]|jgi:leucyl aminopeptidase|nr:leucyl aminopeptidase [Alphaproteobacteria bacterium]|tara:strand:- start:1980 stop:3446 length:1467 start_codon:yes stop_codon:yes gene_type:complete